MVTNDEPYTVNFLIEAPKNVTSRNFIKKIEARSEIQKLNRSTVYIHNFTVGRWYRKSFPWKYRHVTASACIFKKVSNISEHSFNASLVPNLGKPTSCAQTPYFLDYNGFPQYFDQDFGFLLNVERGLPQDFFFWEKKHIAFTVMERQYLRSINSKLLSCRHYSISQCPQYVPYSDSV